MVNYQKIDLELEKNIKINPRIKTDKIVPINKIKQNFKIIIAPRKKFKVTKDKDIVQVYIDGSKNEKTTGYGVHFTDPYIEDIAEPMNEWTSIFQAEAKAIETAAKTLLNLNTINEKIHLYSDSQAVLKALKKKGIKNKYIHNCHQALNELSRNNKIKIIWIPGHAGHQGNEITDTLAKEGSTKEIGNNLYTIPHADPVQKIEKYSKRKIIKQYKETNEHTQTITDRLLFCIYFTCTHVFTVILKGLPGRF